MDLGKDGCRFQISSGLCYNRLNMVDLTKPLSQQIAEYAAAYPNEDPTRVSAAFALLNLVRQAPQNGSRRVLNLDILVAVTKKEETPKI